MEPFKEHGDVKKKYQYSCIHLIKCTFACKSIALPPKKFVFPSISYYFHHKKIKESHVFHHYVFLRAPYRNTLLLCILKFYYDLWVQSSSNWTLWPIGGAILRPCYLSKFTHYLIYWNAPVILATLIKSTRTNKNCVYTFDLYTIYSFSCFTSSYRHTLTQQTAILPFNISDYTNL